MMDFTESPQNRLNQELELLRTHIAQLKEKMEGAMPGHMAQTHPPERSRIVERIREEIKAQIGYVPQYFAPAEGVPEIYASLWSQMRSCYLKNPIPELTKEKLFSRLSRFCPTAYALLSHSCSLKRLGMESGAILTWLEQPVPADESELASCFARFAAAPRPLVVWPEPGSELEQAFLYCTLVLFLSPGKSTRCREELLALLGPGDYARLNTFLAYIRMHHQWLQAYPEPEPDELIQSNLQMMLAEEPRWEVFLKTYYEEPGHPLPATAAAFQTLFPAALEQAPFGVTFLDADYRILKANRAFTEILGFTESEWAALSLPEIIHPQDVHSCMQIMDRVLSGSLPFARAELRFLKQTKESIWCQLTVSPVRAEDSSLMCSLALVDDISARKQGEEKMLCEKHLFERVLRDSQDGIFTFDRELVCTLWNPAMERIFGISEAEAVGRVIFEVFQFLVETGDDKCLLDTLRGETISVRNRPFHIPASGRDGFFDAHFSPLFNDSDRVTGGIGFMRDATDRRNEEESRRVTEDRYLELFENANDIVYTHDLEGRITSLNKVAERITGYERVEALRMKANQLIAPEHLRVVCKMIERQIAGESPVPYEIDIICKDGRRVALEVNTHIITREGKPVGVQGIARDITGRKKTEEALHQAKQNLESWVQELEQRTREMTLLSEMGDMLRACLTTEEAYSVIVRVAQQVFPVQIGALYVISPGRNLVEAVAVWGDSSRVERVFAPDECWALRRGRVHWVEDAEVGLLCKHLHQPPPDGYLCVPMMAQSEALGMLHLTQPTGSRLTEAKQRLASTMAEHIAMALSNLKLHETLRSQSIRDPLTGLFNRRFMEESLELELRRAARNRRPLGLIMLEIDNIQNVNRTLGADAENAILLEIGNLLQTIIRKEDIACRFGADKFTIVLPQGSLEITAQRGEHLREMIRDLEVRHRGRPIGHVTVSGGIAGFPEQGRTVETLIRAADAALQRAKQDGGDRIVAAQ
jgi:diguanylate cyclase (GGDEF)-like protein/PAS domain S-box-containing protein